MQKAGDNYIQQYTGLPNFKLLKTPFDFVTPKEQLHTTLLPFQEFMITLIKLCLTLSLQDLAYRCNLSPPTISRILLKWPTILDIRLQPLIMWSERERI